MIKDFIAVITGVVFLKIKDDKDSITIENVTTLQVRNNGISSVFVNDFEIAEARWFPISELPLLPEVSSKVFNLYVNH